MKNLELRLTDLLARKADEVDVRPVDGFAETPYTTAWAPLDLESTSANSAPSRSRRVALGVLAAAAVVVVIALVATRDDDAVKPADQPSPTVPPTVPPTVIVPSTVPRGALFATYGELEPGTYFVDEVDGAPTARIFVTIGAGWEFPETGPFPDDLGIVSNGGFIHLSRPTTVFSDACHWNAGSYAGPVTTLDGLVRALSEQGGWVDVTTPSNITIDSYAGTTFQRSVPADVSDCDTMAYGPRVDTGNRLNPMFGSWENGIHPYAYAGSFYEAGQIETLLVLDIDGTVVVVNTRPFPEASAAAHAEFAAVLDSIRIEDSDVVHLPTVGFDTTDAAETNPLELVRGSLTSGADVELFRVTTDEPTNWRLTTLTEFDGRTWLIPNRQWSRITDTADAEPDGRTNRQQLQIVALQGQLLPAAADPKQVEPNNDDIRLDRDTDTLLKTSGAPNGNQVTIVSEAPDATLDEMRAATTDNPPDDLFVALPDTVSGVVSDVATEVTAGATTDYDRMIALQDWFRSEFNYDLTVPASADGDAIEMFLETRSGFCEQFASTFAVMARTLGIPSRVAVGFTAGDLNADGSYSVFGKNSHAWPEIWFDGIGWIPFEPTPTRAIPDAED